MKYITRTLIQDVINVYFALLFLYAASSKFFEFDRFKSQIGKSPLITDHANWIAWAIPTLEVIISLALFVPRVQLLALYSSFSLMFIFTVYIAFILTLSPYVPCSCGGILNDMGWVEHLIFNIGSTALAVIGIYLYPRIDRPQHDLTSPNLN
jgi:uncharacterized membrane protein YphA (DoxX/SURF4 family)